MNEQEMMIEESAMTEEERRFTVDDDQKAEWCLEKIREAEAEKDKWKKFYADRLEKINNEQDATIERMRHYLEQYFLTVPHKVTKTQESYQLPSGKLVVKQHGPTFEHDDDQILEWLWANSLKPETYIEIKEKLKWADLKKVLKVAGNGMATEDGEVVPGITVTEHEPEFRVEVKA